MRIPAERIELAVSKDATRPSLMCVNLRIEGEGDERQGWLEASDVYQLVRVPVKVDPEDTPGLFPARALKLARKHRLGNMRVDDAGAHVVTRNGTLTFERVTDAFPDVPSLLVPDSDVFWEFGINSAVLRKAAKAMGDDTVYLMFVQGPDGKPATTRAIGIDAPRKAERAIGLIMPVRAIRSQGALADRSEAKA